MVADIYHAFYILCFVLFYDVQCLQVDIRKYDMNHTVTIARNPTETLLVYKPSMVSCITSCNLRHDCCLSSYNKATNMCRMDLSGFVNLQMESNDDAFTANKNYKEIKIRDCSDLSSTSTSGIYTIHPSPCVTFDVYCDMDTDGGGWTVFQRRFDGSIDFYRSWSEYEEGFGDMILEFWLGNRKISHITDTGSYKLRIDMEDKDGDKRYVECSIFKLKGPWTSYIIDVDYCSGTVNGDSLHYPHHNMQFTTYDKDNDNRVNGNCAVDFHGAWWFNDCHSSHLNGDYNIPSYVRSGVGIVYFYFDGAAYKPLVKTNMMVKRQS